MLNESDHLTFGAGFLLPTLQSLISGLLAALICLAVARLAGWPDPGAWSLAAGSVIAGLVWWSGVAAWRRKVYAPEPGSDPGGAAYTQPPELLRVELTTEGGRQLQLIDLPATHTQLTTLARMIPANGSLAESLYTGAGQPFTRSEFSKLRVELIRRKLAAWNNPGCPARGATLTLAGRAIMRRLSEASRE